MKKQRGQSAVEFALISPLIFLLIFAAIYGGAMFIQFLNFNNQARTIARQIAVAETQAKQQELIDDYNAIPEKEFGLYFVKISAGLNSDGDVVVRYDFNRSEFPFGFPPAHFATSFTMRSETSAESASGGE